MCYSAQIWADFRKFERECGAVMNIGQFIRFFGERQRDGSWRKIPKQMKDAFASPRNEQEREIAAIIAQANAADAHALEAELFKQKTRLTNANRILAAMPTKKAEQDKRIATEKIEQMQHKLDDQRRVEPKPRDSRIFPGWYANVMVLQDGQRTIMPMRYQCRLPGWNEAMERKYPGTYNARRDNLDRTWAKLFGYQHGIMVVNAFYENVARHRAEHRELAPGEQEQNVVLEFKPRPEHDMLVACLWAHDARDGLYSFAAITDEPPAEVAAAGHDRCIIPIKPENVDAWLKPDAGDLAALHRILDDRDRPYYEHRMAA